MRNLITTGALLALLGGPVTIAQTTGSAIGVATIWPIQAISYELGSKRAIGYFEPRDGKCQVTMMIAEAIDPEKAPPLSAARLSLPIQPGESAVLASEEGRSIKLTCGAGAQTVAIKASTKKESEQ